MTQTMEMTQSHTYLPERNEVVNETAERIWAHTLELSVNPDFYRVVHETPLLPVPEDALPEDLRGSGYTLLVKHEGMQPTEAYKLRGATSALLGHKGRAVAASTGNHMTAVAYAAWKLGTGSVDVMCPKDTSHAKLAAARRYGATVHPDFDTLAEALECAEAAGHAADTLFVPPFDDEKVVAGQGTIGVEVAAQLEKLGLGGSMVTYQVPGAGGGVSAGIAVAAEKTLPNVETYVNQPAGAEGILAVLAGQTLSKVQTKVDGAAVARPGRLPMQVLSDPDYVAGVASHEDGYVGEAMAVLGRVPDHKVPEPAGALGMAGALRYMREHPRNSDDTTPHVIVAVTSGTVVTPEKVHEFMVAAYEAGTLTGPETYETYSQAYGERYEAGVDEVLTRRQGSVALSGLLVANGATS